MQETEIDHTICLVCNVAKAIRTCISLMISCYLKGDAMHEAHVDEYVDCTKLGMPAIMDAAQVSFALF